MIRLENLIFLQLIEWLKLYSNTYLTQPYNVVFLTSELGQLIN